MVTTVCKNCIINLFNISSAFHQLTARRFDEDSPQFLQTFRLLMVTAVSKNCIINSFNILSVFLQEDSLKRDLFLRPAREVYPASHIWELKQSISRLNDLPRSWYNKVKKELIQLDSKI